MSSETMFMNGQSSPGDGSSQGGYRVTLPEFEGPLDLLLHLCQTHELDILNISISFIAEKYIEYLELMENMSVEVAADYLVMAAHLAYLKSRELVPSPEPLEASEDGEEPLDPREELIRRLLQYQKYKHAAETLGSRPIEGRNVFLRGVTLEGAGDAGLAEHSVWKLLEHWAQILEKAKPQHMHDVIVDRVSIADRVNHIVDMLEAGKGMVRFEDLVGQHLTEPEQRHQIVVSLLAVLELARLRVIRIMQQEATGTFFLAQVEGAGLADARNLRVTSVKDAKDTRADDAPQVEAAAVDAPAAETPSAEGMAEEAAEVDEVDGGEVTAAEMAEIEAFAAELDEIEAPPSEVAALVAAVDEIAVVETPPAETPAAEASTVEATLFETPVVEAAPAEAPAVESNIVEMPVVREFAAEALKPAETAQKSAGIEAQGDTQDNESQPAVGDPVRQPCQDDVISVPSSAFAQTGEQATDGQTKEEQETTAE